MAKTRIQKIEDIESQMAQMKHDRDRLIAEQKAADRKARDHRVCQRGGYIESVLPEVITFTFEQFKEFIRKTLTTEFAKRELAKIAVQSAEPSEANAPIAVKPVAQGVDANGAVAVSPEKK
ncbi:MAG: DUF3847 domain-containing protein [Clostridiales Family XIII bacterium]|jgi:hypothetical protein|nr:DUF3847 domain-containing protein [Clostridiales Family XIII bacterium]